MSKQDSLKNKIVVVSAGHRGGGAALALRFAMAGAKLVILAPKKTQENIREVAEKIKALKGEALTLEVDFAKENEVQNAVEQIVDHFGGIDVLINNFSIFNFSNVEKTDAEQYDQVMLNLRATFFLSKFCVPHLTKSKNPHVINIAPPLNLAPEVAEEACKNHLLFSLSKYGMSYCTLGMAAEFKNLGVAFNSLWQERPVATPTLTRNFNNDVVRGSNKPEIYAEAAYLIALKSAKTFSGNYYIDADVLREAGIDLAQYAVDPSAVPVKDIFLPGVDYAILKSVW